MSEIAETLPTPTPTKGVPLMLDRERHLRFSLGTIRRLKDKLGKTALEEGVSTDLLAELLWFGLTHEDADLTVEQVEEMVDLEHLTEVMDAVSAATGQRSQLAKGEEDPTMPTTDKQPVLVVGETKPAPETQS